MVIPPEDRIMTYFPKLNKQIMEVSWEEKGILAENRE
jgi:hypothetical protein